MAEPTSFKFSHKEVVELMVKKQGITEGLWALQVTFAFGAGNAGQAADSVVPTAFVGVSSIGIQQAPEPTAITVDASKL